MEPASESSSPGVVDKTEGLVGQDEKATDKVEKDVEKKSWRPYHDHSKRFTVREATPVLDRKRNKLVIQRDVNGMITVASNNTVDVDGAKFPWPTRYQYVYRMVGGKRRVAGVFVAVFFNQYSAPRVSAAIGWSLTNFSAGDVFDRNQAIRRAVYRAIRIEDVNPLPPSMIVPALFFGTSITRDCVRMGMTKLKKRTDSLVGGSESVLTDVDYPYPDFVEIAGLFPLNFVSPPSQGSISARMYIPFNITNWFINDDQHLVSWSVPYGVEDTSECIMDKIQIPCKAAASASPASFEADPRAIHIASCSTTRDMFLEKLSFDPDGKDEDRTAMIIGVLRRLVAVHQRTTYEEAETSPFDKYVKPLHLFS